MTDIALTENGQLQAELLGKKLKGHAFETILSSPLRRAATTCELAGFLNKARLDPNLVEWNYGEYEGRTTPEIQKANPHWNIFSNGAPGGETVADVSARANKILNHILPLRGDVALFSHGHFLRVLGAKWLGLNAQEGRHFALSPGSVSILGFERNEHVFLLWNDTSH
jgi:probable phosphoglycerate mutase